LRQGKNILSEKYRVATSPSAAKLLELLKNNKPALILMDINIGGYEAIKDIPVIFLSENSADKEKCLGLGAAGYVSKPFDSATLMDCVEKILHTNKEVFQHGN
jgi:CheY-like chemotaxis protein